jgi:outer membrane scaffolding protein for murein synthesis (MipA/OmpV family)
MDEIINYKMCAVKVRNAKLRNYLKYMFVDQVRFSKTWDIDYFQGNRKRDKRKKTSNIRHVKRSKDAG